MQDGGFFPGSYRFRTFINNTRADIARRVEVERAEGRAVRTRVQQAAMRVFERLRALFRPRQPVLDGGMDRDSADNNQPGISVRDQLLARIRAIINQQAATGR
jgi:hypothetical protein